ncbi:MAG: hypothetical protein ABII12_17860 [Planctomycetota bacterium]
MHADRTRRLLMSVTSLALVVALVGCEGIDRKHDARLSVDIEPPPEGAPAVAEEPVEVANFPDLVEEMMATRERHLHQLMELERAYMLAGDTVHANWARRQRELTEDIEVYPYLLAGTPEQAPEIVPLEEIPEADGIYTEAVKLFKEVQTLPFGGHLDANKKKAARALKLFKSILQEYPTSDKVDDCAYYCGEIYKEYLRDDDPDNELAVRYYKWAFALDPQTPHPTRFQCAVVYDFRRHDRVRALDLYHQVLETDEDGNESNARWAATRIEQLTDETRSHLSPKEPITTAEPRPDSSASAEDALEPEPAPPPMSPPADAATEPYE